MSKYHARITMRDGIKFHSKKEAARYQQLKYLQMAGDIYDLTCQPSFLLFKGRRNDFDKIKDQNGTYTADFAYTLSKDQELVSTTYVKRNKVYFTEYIYIAGKKDQQVIEDVKSEITSDNALFRFKWRWVRSTHPEIIFLMT